MELVCRTCGAVVHFVKGRWAHEQDPEGCPMLIVAWPEGRIVDDDEAA